MEDFLFQSPTYQLLKGLDCLIEISQNASSSEEEVQRVQLMQSRLDDTGCYYNVPPLYYHLNHLSTTGEARRVI